MPNKFTLDIDAEMLRILKPPGTQPVMPKLLKFLRQKQAGRPQKTELEKTFGLELPEIPEELTPKRSSRGLVYPGIKPTPSPFPFLKKVK